jgi:hypothetical protein
VVAKGVLVLVGAAVLYHAALEPGQPSGKGKACADLQQAAALGINVKPSLMQSCNR